MTSTAFLNTIILALETDSGEGSFGKAMRGIWDFLYLGGFFMLVIGLCSIFAITVIIYKALSLRREIVLPRETDYAIRNALDPDHPDGENALRTAVADTASPLGRIASVAASSKLKTREEAQDAVQSYARAEVVKLDTGVPAMEVVITIAPLLGLLGTAAGLVGVFGALGGEGTIDDTDPTLLAQGIARALSTTIAGLAVAVPTVIAHSYFSKKIEVLAVEMEVLIGALINRVHPSSPAGSKPATSSESAARPSDNTIGELADAVAAASSLTDPPATQEAKRPPNPPQPGPTA